VGSSEFYPLQVGATWHYRGPGHTRTIRVAKHELVEGTPCALVETLRDREVILAEHIFTKPDVVYGLTSNGQKLPAPLPLLKLPPQPGKSWRVRFSSPGKVTEWTYVLGREPVEVPAGKYDALTLRGELLENGLRQLAFTYWLAKGVGPVKQVLRLPEQTIAYELERAELP
jgi:hypothetical protein